MVLAYACLLLHFGFVLCALSWIQLGSLPACLPPGRPSLLPLPASPATLFPLLCSSQYSTIPTTLFTYTHLPVPHTAPLPHPPSVPPSVDGTRLYWARDDLPAALPFIAQPPSLRCDIADRTHGRISRRDALLYRLARWRGALRIRAALSLRGGRKNAFTHAWFTRQRAAWLLRTTCLRIAALPPLPPLRAFHAYTARTTPDKRKKGAGARLPLPA